MRATARNLRAQTPSNETAALHRGVHQRRWIGKREKHIILTYSASVLR